MKPIFFSFFAWERHPQGKCEDQQLLNDGTIRGDYRGLLSFSLDEDRAKFWPDILGTTAGIQLFSDRVRTAFSKEKICGITFFEAKIVRVDNPNPKLNKTPRPDYFWGRCDGLVKYDEMIYKERQQTVPICAEPSEGVDIFHLNRPKGPSGYICMAKVLEAFHKHGINNLSVKPLDYYEVFNPTSFAPPFRIDVLAKKWPPAQWYPEGFEPHLNNLEAE